MLYYCCELSLIFSPNSIEPFDISCLGSHTSTLKFPSPTRHRHERSTNHSSKASTVKTSIIWKENRTYHKRNNHFQTSAIFPTLLLDFSIKAPTRFRLYGTHPFYLSKIFRLLQRLIFQLYHEPNTFELHQKWSFPLDRRRLFPLRIYSLLQRYPFEFVSVHSWFYHRGKKYVFVSEL